MKKIIGTISLFFFFAPSSFAALFPDVSEEHWGHSYVARMAQEEIMKGDPSGRFRPEDSVNRAELAKIAVMVARKKGSLGIGEVTNQTPAFKDVPADSWFYTDASLCAANEWIMGYKNYEGYLTGEFGPGNEVTRAEAIKVLLLASGTRVKSGNFMPFVDVTSEHWAAPYLQTAKDAGIISGAEEGRFYPSRPLKRVELAKIVGEIL